MEEEGWPGGTRGIKPEPQGYYIYRAPFELPVIFYDPMRFSFQGFPRALLKSRHVLILPPPIECLEVGDIQSTGWELEPLGRAGYGKARREEPYLILPYWRRMWQGKGETGAA